MTLLLAHATLITFQSWQVMISKISLKKSDGLSNSNFNPLSTNQVSHKPPSNKVMKRDKSESSTERALKGCNR